MLITLQSTNDADASDFRNFFKESVMIEPKSEIALVNMSYNFETGITVTNSNNQFQVKLGKDIESTITVPIGEYTADGFVTALENSLNTYINGRPYEIERLFEGDVTKDTDGKIKLEIKYAAQDWSQTPIRFIQGTEDRGDIDLSNAGLMLSGGDGIITNNFATGGLDGRTWRSGNASAANPVWASADDNPTQPHGYYKFTIQQNDASIYVCLNQNDRPATINTSDIQFRIRDTSFFDIFEKNSAGTPQSILTSTISYNAFDTFEIRVEQIEPITLSKKIRYFQNGTEIISEINPTADRFLPRPVSKMVCCGSFDTGVISAQIVDGGGTYEVTSCINTASMTISTPGTGYLANEVVSLTATSGSESLARVTSVNGTGGITGLVFIEHGGNIDAAGENITIVGKISGANNGVLSTGVPDDSVDITLPGGATAYALGAADIQLQGGGIVVGAVDITAINGTNGVDDFTWTSLLPNQVAVGDTLTIIQGAANDCELLVNATNSLVPSVGDVKWSTIAPGIDEPLIKQSQASFTPSAGFLGLTNLPAVSGDADPSLVSQGTSATTDGKETDQMLVNVEEFQIKSICKNGGIQKAVASVPYGQTQNPSGTSASGGYFFHESYNLNYHQLENAGVENHNQLRIRLTDAVGEPLLQLKHPTTITLDLRPRAK